MSNILNNRENNDTGEIGLVIPSDLLSLYNEERSLHCKNNVTLADFSTFLDIL